MSTRAFTIIDADYERDLPLLRAVREPVFVHEQQVPIELEWDELDPLLPESQFKVMFRAFGWHVLERHY